MIDNEYAYELTSQQAAVLDVPNLLQLVDMNMGYFRDVKTTASLRLQRVNRSFGGCLLGLSMFKLPSPEDMMKEAHIDKNMNAKVLSRDCALNVVLGVQDNYIEWWTGNDRTVRVFGLVESSSLQVFPCASNRIVYSMKMERPTLLNTNIPHLGYSKPGGGILLSFGFTRSFNEMREWFKQSNLMQAQGAHLDNK